MERKKKRYKYIKIMERKDNQKIDSNNSREPAKYTYHALISLLSYQRT